MDSLSRLLDLVAAPFLIPFGPDQRIYVFYLVTALAIAYLTLVMKGRGWNVPWSLRLFPRLSPVPDASFCGVG